MSDPESFLDEIRNWNPTARGENLWNRYGQIKVWIQRGGVPINIADMTPNHARSAARGLRDGLVDGSKILSDIETKAMNDYMSDTEWEITDLPLYQALIARGEEQETDHDRMKDEDDRAHVACTKGEGQR